MKVLVLELLAIAALEPAFACAGETPSTLSLQPNREVTAEDYDDVLKRWTRHDTVYQGLDSKLFVHATFMSPEFRRAFALRHTEVYGPGSEETAVLITNPEAEEQLEFFFSASTSSPQWNDFDKENSIWRVTVEGDDHERVDGKVRRIRPSANMRIIFPYISDYAKTYVVRFPRTTPSQKAVITASTREFDLKVSSALGQATLSWNLNPTAPPPKPIVEPLPKKGSQN
jgi:hypothetical protein